MLPVNSISPDVSAHRLLEMGRNMRAGAEKYIAQCNAGSVNLHDLANGFLLSLSYFKADWAIHSATSGVAAAVAARFPNKVFNAATEISNVGAAIQTMINDLEASLPVDGSNRLLTQTLRKDGSGMMDQRTLTTPANLATLKTKLEAFRDTLDPN